MSPLDRRQFLSRSAAMLSAGGLGALAGVVAEADSHSSAPQQSSVEQSRDTLATELATRVSFDGPHQAGILTAAQAQSTLVALDSIAPDRSTLIVALRNLSERARSLAHGDTVGAEELDDPPPDSGILGPVNAPDQLTVTIAFGASLFDYRYGLQALKPKGLEAMPNFPHDDLDPTRSHGDVLISVCAGQRDTVVHTVRELMRSVVGHLTPRWSIDGFKSARRGPTPANNPRNLFAFRDGTANPDVQDASLMDELIWVQPALHSSGEPAWAAGGTYQVVRTIRMHVEFWDRVGMFEQQNMIGRYRVTGAPLGATSEFEDPRYDLDPEGKRIPLIAHIRLANPRTPPTANQRILRRGYNYERGIDEAGNLDQGLLFVAFNQDIQRQFATIQTRLQAEEMTDYITPVGGGYFFAPPGSRGPGDWVGSGLFV
ncbi:MAG TPA: iron uptake transporter deferrochelatase/peroxidase subunit [Solirubrobacteraceae bacterium]